MDHLLHAGHRPPPAGLLLLHRAAAGGGGASREEPDAATRRQDQAAAEHAAGKDIPLMMDYRLAMLDQKHIVIDLGHRVDVSGETGDLNLFMSQFPVQFADISDSFSLVLVTFSLCYIFFAPYVCRSLH